MTSCAHYASLPLCRRATGLGSVTGGQQGFTKLFGSEETISAKFAGQSGEGNPLQPASMMRQDLLSKARIDSISAAIFRLRV